MATAKAPAAPPPPIRPGSRLLYGSIGMAVGLCIGLTLWAYDALAHRHLDYLVTGLTLSLILGGIGFFATQGKHGWRDTLLYFLLLGFLDSN